MPIDMIELGKAAKAASLQLRQLDTETKNNALLAIAESLEKNRESILEANQLDIQAARENGLSEALIDRLNLQKRLNGVITDVRHVATLPDPIGVEFEQRTLPNGLKIKKRRVPIGVLGVIYESRPNVTVDVAALAFKTGNAVILRGGSETLNSNIALIDAIHQGLRQIGVSTQSIQLIRDTDRRYVKELLRLSDYVDLIIPRGGNSLHQFCRQESTIPVITGGIGICHLYVDETADLQAAIPVIHNAKVQRPSVCNALDTLLVNRAIAEAFIPQVVARLAEDGVQFRVDEDAAAILNGHECVQLAQEGDWDTEWLSLILGIRIVDNLDEAIEHIQAHSTNHSDGILTTNPDAMMRFLNEIDSAAVYINASTRFTDGGQLGLGAEIAVSTQKVHARGPMGLVELTSYKWIIIGDNHIRE